MPGTVTVLTPYVCYLTCPLTVLGDVCSQAPLTGGYRALEFKGLAGSYSQSVLWLDLNHGLSHTELKTLCYRNCIRLLWLLNSETLVVIQGIRILLSSFGKINSRMFSLSSSYT